ncbi:30S ribosomal protein S21 [Candidatus Daviesbacteria bacterium RIFOXYD1_FULL_41_10]|uniref:Small ribosomal subunit protein bS21 n=1 Tax=Candidatus Daviesbacteria bacterium RIFOXYD1_FULL_41_10 TaxID=1797801 RepID=A0A1F5N0Y4_9BACT|nr:MAG: 30S ribosomal protein S21 [Candidatus Daviesbacteria bacterium RIFOXYD1_FULL_41_10]
MFFVSIIIRRGPNDTTDSVIRKFQKKVALENVVQEYRDRQFHKTKSEIRQERRAEKTRKIMRAKRMGE